MTTSPPIASQSPTSSGAVDVSVVIANWNGEALLSHCLASIYRETKAVSYEVILCDDCSTDNSLALVKEKFPLVHIHRNAVNAGFARTNNAALPLVRGRFILLLNNDTIIENDALSAMVALLDSLPDVGACGGRLVDRGPSRQHSFGSFPGIRTELGRAFGFSSQGLFRSWPSLSQHPPEKESTQEVGYIVGADLMIRAELAQKLGLFDEAFEAYFEDTDLCFRVWQAGYRVLFTSAARIIHLVGQSYGSETVVPSERKVLLMEKGFVRFCRKNYGSFHCRAVLWMRSWALRQQIAWLSFRTFVEPKRRHLRYRDTLKLLRISLAKFRQAVGQP